MNVEFCKHISPSIYDELKYSFGTFSYVYSKEWHDLLEREFGWVTSGVIKRDDQGKLVCFLPLVRVSVFLFRSSYVALPLSYDTSALCKPFYSLTENEISGLLSSEVEIRSAKLLNDFHAEILGYSNRIDLASYSDEDLLFASFHKASIQRKINKARKNEVQVTRGCSDLAMREFYEMLLETRRRQGAPIYPDTFFQSMRDVFDGSQVFELYIARYKGVAVAGIVTLSSGSTVVYAYGASRAEFMALGGNQLVMWEAIRRSHRAGLDTFDFGFTPLSNVTLMSYKRKWGGVEVPYYKAVAGKNNGGRQIRREGRLIDFVGSVLKLLPRQIYIYVSKLIILKVA